MCAELLTGGLCDLPQQVERDRRCPLAIRQLQPSVEPQVRNPFKAPAKSGEESEWRRIQNRAADEMSGGVGCNSKEEGGEENVESYQGKALPAGMKIKKRGSDEKGRVLEGDGEGEKTTIKTTTTEVETKVKKGDGEEKRDKKRSVSTTNEETPSPNSQKPLGELPQPPVSDAGSKVNTGHSSSPSSSATPSTGEKPNQPLTSAPKDLPKDPQRAPSKTTDPSTSYRSPRGEVEEDDDEVEIVSVKPGKQTTTSLLAPVQKSLTSFPGFRAPPQFKGRQDDPMGLRNLLTTQLQQKKVCL